MQPFRLFLLFLALSLLGVAFIPLLPVSLLPQKEGHTLSIYFNIANSSPELAELQVTSILENAVSTLAGIKKTESVSGYNSGSVILQLSKKADVDFLRLELNTIFRRLYPAFPAGTSYPRISVTREEQNEAKPLLVLSFNAPFAAVQIREMVEKAVMREVAAIEGVSELRFSGAGDRQLNISWDQEKAQAYKMGKETFSRIFQRQAADLSLGTSVVNGNLLPLTLKMQVQGIDELNRTEISTPNGEVVPFALVGKVTAEEQAPRQVYRINGLNSVNLAVFAHESVNQILLSDKIQVAIQQSKRSLPDGFEVITEYDDTEYLRKELAKIGERALLAVVLLTLFIFFVRREWTYLFILLSGALVTVFLTALVVFLTGLEVHLYSIAGLTLSFGLIIDNTLVMTDHLRRKGNRKVFLALLGASLTTVAALLVVFFLPEEEKGNLVDFSLAVCIALGNSLLVALFYIPAVHELLNNPRYKKTTPFKGLKRRISIFKIYESVLRILFRFRKGFIFVLILWFGLPVFWLPHKWEGQEWYNATIGNETYQEHVRPWVDRLLGGTLRMFVSGVFEKSSYRTPEKTYLYVSASLPYGHTLEQMDQVIRRMEEYLKGVDGIDKFITQVVSGETAFITITFLPEHEISSLPYQLKSQLISKAINLGGVKWSVYGVGQGFSNQSSEQLPSFRVMLKGYNYHALERQANNLASKLLAHPRIQEVEADGKFNFFERTSHEYVFTVDPQKTAKYKLPVSEMISEVSAHSYPSNPSFQLSVNNKVMPVYLQAVGAGDFSVYNFRERYFYRDSLAFQMKRVGDLAFREVRNAIRKENRQYLRMVSFDYFGSHHFGSRYLDQVLDEMKPAFPPGYSAERMDSNWSWEEVQRQYGLLLVLLAVIYWICAILFENLKQPFYILLTIPVSFLGLLGAFAWFDLYFDQGGYAAFILLGGLVVNSSIFIVNDFNNEKKYSNNCRIAKAASGKFFPITMTILSTCLGLVPFLVDGQNEVFWFSLAAGTIGGLLMSFVAVFLLVPVLMMKPGQS